MFRISFRNVAYVACAAIAGTAAMVAPSVAHHSTAMFEWGTASKIDNVKIERWVWTNPHTVLYVRDRAGKRWAFEGMSPNHLARAGWSKRSLVPGEMVDLTYFAPFHHARSVAGAVLRQSWNSRKDGWP